MRTVYWVRDTGFACSAPHIGFHEVLARAQWDDPKSPEGRGFCYRLCEECTRTLARKRKPNVERKTKAVGGATLKLYGGSKDRTPCLICQKDNGSRISISVDVRMVVICTDCIQAAKKAIAPGRRRKLIITGSAPIVTAGEIKS